MNATRDHLTHKLHACSPGSNLCAGYPPPAALPPAVQLPQVPPEQPDAQSQGREEKPGTLARPTDACHRQVLHQLPLQQQLQLQHEQQPGYAHPLHLQSGQWQGH